MKRFSLLLFIISVVLQRISAQNKIYTSNEYSIFSDSIIQNKFTAKALSDSELISSYQSPANLYQSSGISFKFSINGKDNEMKSGTDNFFYCKDSINETPLIKFGEH